jgi:GntR family transcriptional regulator of gluconate operon
VEGVLAEEFDVSRGPVRDALSILTAQGLAQAQRQGVVVRGLNDSDIEELYTLRMAIESLALRMAIERTRDEPGAWEVAAAEVEKLMSSAETGHLSHYAEYDLAFHSEFYRLSRHVRLQHIWEQYFPIFAVILKLTNEQDGTDLRPSAADHRLLLNLAIKGEVEEAAKVLHEHLKGSLRRLRRARR